MKRLFWLGLGVAVGAVVAQKVVRSARAYTPRGLVESAQTSAAGLLGTVHDFLDDVRDAMEVRESELTAALLERPAGETTETPPRPEK
jgi:hypothetical protein